ncbi:MAG TPA: hypothetical protein VNU48_09510, partial [Burkholderiaceae bacterium]|nr:hypothetical protein [Burkholderiaceae bacterium]
MKITRLADAELPESAARIIGRFYFGTNAAAGLASAAILSTLLPQLPLAHRVWLGGSSALFGLLCLLALRFSAHPRFPMHAALCGVGAIAMALTGFFSVLLGEGLRGPPLAFCGLIVCVVGSITHGRASLALGAFAALEMTLLAWLEARGLIHGRAAATPLGMVLFYQWLVVLCGTIGGSLIARVLA